MSLIRRLHAPDVAALPIGDRATTRLTGAEPALELLEPKVCTPWHSGTWPDFFTGTPTSSAD